MTIDLHACLLALRKRPRADWLRRMAVGALNRSSLALVLGAAASAVRADLSFQVWELPRGERREATVFTLAADMDSDGDFDVLGTIGGRLTIRWNDGAGNFLWTVSPVSVGVSAWPADHMFPLPLDLDNDGDLDVAVPQFIVRNDGVTLGDSQKLAKVDMAWGSIAAAADLNRDGLVDIVTRFGRIWHNDGGLAFHEAGDLNYGESQAAVGDFDGDGAVDILAGAPTPRIYWGPSFTETTVPAIPDAGNRYRISSADLNLDGRPECIVDYPYVVLVLRSESSRTIAIDNYTVTAGLNDGPLMVGDLDLDGWPDLFNFSTYVGSPWLKNEGNGRFVVGAGKVGGFLHGAADLDLDGDLDLLYRGWMDGVATALRNLLRNGPMPSPREAWREGHFSTRENAGDAADMADPDLDGLVNLVEYAFGTNPKSSLGLDGNIGDPRHISPTVAEFWVPYPMRRDLRVIIESFEDSNTWQAVAQWAPTDPYGNNGWSVNVNLGPVEGARRRVVLETGCHFCPYPPVQRLMRLRVEALR